MPHVHGSPAARDRRLLVVVFGLTLGVFVVELIGGYLSDSLALLADAGHNFTDVAGIGLALLAIHYAARPATRERTFGYLRLEILAAVVNAVFLFGVAAFVLFEAIQRWADPPTIASGLMLAVALIGLAANGSRSSSCATPSATASTCGPPISRSWATWPARSRWSWRRSSSP